MADTLKNCLEQLEKNSIHIQHFRSLALGETAYQQEVVEEVQKHCRYFYIRIDESKKLQETIKDIAEHEWQSITLGYQKVQVACTPFFPFDGKKTYNAVVQRRERKDKQADLFTGTAYSYYAVLTNNEKDTAEWITRFYNERGTSEKNFDILNNDFNLAWGETGGKDFQYPLPGGFDPFGGQQDEIKEEFLDPHSAVLDYPSLGKDLLDPLK